MSLARYRRPTASLQHGSQRTLLHSGQDWRTGAGAGWVRHWVRLVPLRVRRSGQVRRWRATKKPWPYLQQYRGVANNSKGAFERTPASGVRPFCAIRILHHSPDGMIGILTCTVQFSGQNGYLRPLFWHSLDIQKAPLTSPCSYPNCIAAGAPAHTHSAHLPTTHAMSHLNTGLPPPWGLTHTPQQPVASHLPVSTSPATPRRRCPPPGCPSHPQAPSLSHAVSC